MSDTIEHNGEDTRTQTSASNLNPGQELLVDKAFKEIFGYDWGTQFRLEGELSPEEIMLCDMLGQAATARIVKSSGRKHLRLLVDHPQRTKAAIPRKINHKKPQSVKHPPPSKATHSPAKKNEVSGGPPTNELKAETSAGSSRSTAPVSGVDSLLQTINSTGKISTIAKTSADWEQFKEKTGLGDKLEEQATSNNAYLNKQDFLDRVDHRTFEVEKKQRDIVRQKRGA